MIKATPLLQVYFDPPEPGTTYGGYPAVVYSALVSANQVLEINGRRVRKDGNEHLTKYPRRDININNAQLITDLLYRAQGLKRYYELSFEKPLRTRLEAHASDY